jgi:hypothetical protein
MMGTRKIMIVTLVIMCVVNLLSEVYGRLAHITDIPERRIRKCQTGFRRNLSGKCRLLYTNQQVGALHSGFMYTNTTINCTCYAECQLLGCGAV